MRKVTDRSPAYSGQSESGATIARGGVAVSEWDDAVARLTEENWRTIESLNARIKAHQGPWGRYEGGQELKPGVRQMPFAVPDRLVSEFVAIWDQLKLIIPFDWSNWDEGRKWFADADSTKYDKLDNETALKLLTTLIRLDRFVDGTLIEAFASQQIPRIIDRFVKLREPGAHS